MLVKCLDSLGTPRPLAQPFRLGGVGAGILVTHIGTLPFLPADMGTTYFSAEASANLLSLGQVQRCGGSYRSLPSMQLGVYDA
jgi:hypothetical protein